MCLAVPACILSISDARHCLAIADSGGVQRQIDLSCVTGDIAAEDLIGRWVLVHVGVALAVISDEEAQASLEIWSQLQDLP
ncbi:HypC/HybG/HupF family hydrogenase formation chaperone [Marinobacterium rhizophilum]|uniref:HypC/HybG/HupF family hydrogenase formation chaperone n=1 Tax=Marinobacterium rhizophilum TaxID=420402 RepID=A0ABY5HID5_9GAMM|nr:HypC/HybG/HupF family hydrogenase formation chaperone [Marinobacterium rhizophilum]UTW11621.1 HypC/HybG/HupF family hydrogenase formation chaperone [Marinobacterium rhizophilum]